MTSQFDVPQLGKLALRSARSVFLIDLLQKISGPLLTVILAWFLSPEELGILGIAGIVLALAAIIQQAGIADAIIQRQENDESIYVAFWISIAVGAVLYALIWFFAPAISRVFSEPNSALVIRVLSIQLIISSFGTVPIALLKRNFEFDQVLTSQFYAALVPFMISIPMGLYGFGYWAVIAGILCSNLLFVFLIWWRAHYLPKFIFNGSHALRLFRFGGLVVLESLLGWFFIYFDNAVVGAVLGTATLGMYSMAFNLTNSAIGLPVGALAGVSLVTFSRLQHDQDALRRMYMDGTKLIAAYAIPASLGLALLSEPLAQVLFNERWMGVGPLMSVLALYAGLAHIWILNSHVFKSMGRPDVILRIYIPLLLLIIPVFLVSVNYGVLIFAIMRSIVVIFFGGILHTVYAVKMLGLKWNYVWTCCRSPFFASVFLAICLTGLNQIFWDGSPWLSLTLKMILGLGVYLIGLFIFDKTFLLGFFDNFGIK